MSLETLSGARHLTPPKHTPPARTPALRWGPGKAAGKPERAPRGPSAAPPGAARGRPGPLGRGPLRPRGAPRRRALALPSRLARAPAPQAGEGVAGPSTLSARPTAQIGRRQTTPPARAPLAVLPPCACPRPGPSHSSSSGSLPSGARPDPVTRVSGTARTSPCPPFWRARRGCTRRDLGRDAPALPGVLSRGHLLAGEGRCREGEGAERRRGAAGGEGPVPNPQGRQSAPPPEVLIPSSGLERDEEVPSRSGKGEIRENVALSTWSCNWKIPGKSPRAKPPRSGPYLEVERSLPTTNSRATSHLPALWVKDCQNSGKTPETSWHLPVLCQMQDQCLHAPISL